jgi:E3 ubiquitin-protein ligase RNF115/126
MDDVITQLMEQGQGSNAPPPASTETIDSLPRLKADKSLIEGGKECTVCRDGFSSGEDVIRLPCLHVLSASLPFVPKSNCIAIKIVFCPG